MKRVDPPADSQGDAAPKPAKRTKISKACQTCRQQKTRCDPVTEASDRPLRCKRCTHFKIECSFETSPPNKPAALPPVHQLPPGSYAWGAAPSSHLSHRPPNGAVGDHAGQGWPASPGSSSRLHGSASSPDGPSPFSSTRSLRYESSVGESPAANDPHAIVGLGPGGPREFPLPELPVAPPSPPRKIEHLYQDTKSSMEHFTSKPAWVLAKDNPNRICRFPRPGPNQYLHGAISFARGLVMPTSIPTDTDTIVIEDNMISRGLVSAADADILSLIWQNRYAPWIPSESSNSQAESSSSSFLQCAQWILASSHLPSTYVPTSSCCIGLENDVSASVAALRTRLSSCLDRSIVRAMMGLDSSLTSLRALMILARWAGGLPGHLVGETSPIISSTPAQSTNMRVSFDGEQFLSAAMKMASKMHLELDVEIAVTHKREQMKKKEANPTPLNAKTLDRARLMFAVSILDAYFNIGSGRKCGSRVNLSQAEEIFGSPSVLSTQPGCGADARIVFQCNILDIALRCIQLCDQHGAAHFYGAQQWANRINDELKTLDRMHQPLQTAVALSDHNDSLPYSIVNVEAHFIKLQLCCRAFKSARAAFAENRSTVAMNVVRAITGRSLSRPELDEHNFSEDEIIINGPAEDWARIARESAETLMVSTLALGRQTFVAPALPGENVLPLLSYAPEQMACMILFAPTFAIKIQLLSLAIFHCDSVRSDMSKSLIERVRDMFKAAAPHTPHDPSIPTPNYGALGSVTVAPPTATTLVGRCGEVLSTLLKLWDARTNENKNRDADSTKPRGPPLLADVKEMCALSGAEIELAQRERMSGASSAVPRSEETSDDPEGLHMIASTLSSMRTMGAQRSQHPTPHSQSRSASGSPQPAHSNPLPQPSATIAQPQPEDVRTQPQQYFSNAPVSEPINADASDLSNMDMDQFMTGVSFDFDMSQFLDPTLTFGIEHLNQFPVPMSAAYGHNF